MRMASRIILVVDKFRPARWDTVRHYDQHFLGVVHIVGAGDWPACLQLGNVSCKLQYREFYPGDGHLFGVGSIMLAIASRLGK